MKVGILGSGDVAKALAGGFLRHGHEVMLGTREPSKLSDWATKNPKASIGSFSKTADMGKAEAARAIEPLAILWCIPAFLRSDWNHAFKMLSK